jgi:hypothetical protein
MNKSGDGEMPEKEGQPTVSFSGQETPTAGKYVGEKPDLRVVQVEYDTRLGKSVYKDVGAMWKNTSKAGNEFYTMKIGKLKLLVFPNNRKLQGSLGDSGAEAPLDKE